MPSVLPQGDEKRRTVEAMFDRIAGRYDLLNAVISCGTHMAWKRSAVAALDLAPGDTVIDLACGTGDLCEEVRRYGARAIGVDVSAGMLRAAARRGSAAALVRGSGDAMPILDGRVDAVVCGFALRNFVAIEPVLAELHRVLRPGGRLALIEVDRPDGGVVRRLHGLYFERIVPFVGGLLSDRSAYRYLPSSAAYLPDEGHLRAMLVAAGFGDVVKRRFLAGAAQLVTARRRGLQ